MNATARNLGGAAAGVVLATMIAGCSVLDWGDVRRGPEGGAIPFLDARPVPESAASPSPHGAAGLTIEHCVALALRNGPAVRAAVEDEARARGVHLSALSAFLPRASAALSYTRVDQVPEFSTADAAGNPVTLRLGAEDNVRAEVTVRQPLFQGGAGTRGLELASLGREDAALRTEAARSAVAFQTRKAYLDVLAAREALDVREKTLAAAETHRAAVETRRGQGLATRFDALRAGVRVKSAEAGWIQARGALEAASNDLRRLVGLPGDAELRLAESFRYRPVKADAASSIKRAMEGRPDLKRSALAVESQRARKGVALSGLLPKAYAFFSGGWERPSPKQFVGTDGQGYWNAGLVVDVPLFDGLDSLGRVRRESAGLRAARWAHEERRAEVLLEVKTAVSAVEVAAEFVASQGENVRQAEEALRLAEVGFEGGVNTTLDVLDAQTALTGARLDYLEAVRGHTLAAFALRRAEGGR